jgi:photosystem II stability/assembly factor-like uncharacterized protein
MTTLSVIARAGDWTKITRPSSLAVGEFVGGQLTFRAATPIADAMLIAVGKRGAIGQSRDQGRTWSALPSRTHHDLRGIASIPNANLLIAVGDKGTVLRGTVNGDQVRWDPPTKHGDEDLLGIASIPSANLLIAVGDKGTVLRGKVDGDQVSWDPPARQGDEDLLGIAGVSGNVNLLAAVGADGTVLRLHVRCWYEVIKGGRPVCRFPSYPEISPDVIFR